MAISQRSILLPLVALLIVTLVLTVVGTEFWHAMLWGAVTAIIVAVTSNAPSRGDRL